MYMHGSMVQLSCQHMLLSIAMPLHHTARVHGLPSMLDLTTAWT